MRIFSLVFLVSCGGGAEPPAAHDLGATLVDLAPTTLSACAQAACNAMTGRCEPLPTCSAAAPCHGLNGAILTTPITMPTCKGSHGAGSPSFDDGNPVVWTDTNGDKRAACEYFPPGAGAASERPLVVFMPGSFGSADSIYTFMSLRVKAPAANLSGAAARPGFVFASPQGRNLHWEGAANFEGAHEDYFYRDLASPSTNPDIRAVDKLIDDLVATGKVDRKRIYITGWSNGATFSHLYAIARHTTATPGGNNIAAAAVFAGDDPFADFKGDDATCAVKEPQTAVPIYLIHRDCDLLVPCDSAQQMKFATPSKNDVEDWVATLKAAGDSVVRDVIIDKNGNAATQCAAAAVCTAALGTANHLHWPDGVDDGSGKDWEPEMLLFLRNHPLP